MTRFTFIFFIVSSLSILSTNAQKKYLLRGQSENFPLYTELDSATIYSQIERLSLSNSLKIEEINNFMQKIDPLLEKEDPLAMLAFYQIFENEVVDFSQPSRIDERNTYLLKLAEKKCAVAELILFHDYYTGKNELITDADTALTYLKKAIKHADTFNSAFAGILMAEIYNDLNNKFNIIPNNEKALKYLNESLKSGNSNIQMIARAKLPDLYKQITE